MVKRSKGTKKAKGRSLFEELSAGVQSMQDHREGASAFEPTRFHRRRPLPTNSHLHTFTAGGFVCSEPSREWETPVRNERCARLEQVAKEEGEAFIYEYDMGDSWRHPVGAFAIRTTTKHEQSKTWIEAMTGGPCDPDAFDLEAVNRALAKLR